MNKYLMTIDAGTGSARAVIFDINGNQISVGQEEWEHLSLQDVPNSMSFDYDNNWQLILKCIKKALDDASLTGDDIVALSATSMREGIVLYDENNLKIELEAYDTALLARTIASSAFGRTTGAQLKVDCAI